MAKIEDRDVISFEYKSNLSELIKELREAEKAAIDFIAAIERLNQVKIDVDVNEVGGTLEKPE